MESNRVIEPSSKKIWYMSERSAEILLADIREALAKIATYVQGLDEAAFVGNGMVVDAVLRNISVIGEAASKLPDEFIRAHPEIEWRKIVGMRNRLVHGYFGVSLPLVWQTIHGHLPEFRDKLDKL